MKAAPVVTCLMVVKVKIPPTTLIQMMPLQYHWLMVRLVAVMLMEMSCCLCP